MTEPEIWLWARLKRLRERGFHFRRQAPLHGYYLDFVCFQRRLVIELDGGQHADAVHAEHDGVRDAILTRAGFQVLRFWNGAVRSDIEAVMHQILEALEAAEVVLPGRSSSVGRARSRDPHPSGAARRPPSP